MNYDCESFDPKYIEGFFTARTLLPSPQHYKSNIFIVSIGKDEPMRFKTVHLYSSQDSHVYVFHRYPIPDRPNQNQWICQDARLQDFIYQNRFEASLIIQEIEIDISGLSH